MAWDDNPTTRAGVMKSLMPILLSVARDIERLTGTDLQLDVKRVQRRVEEEGESFLTIRLPAMGAAFEEGLAHGCLTAKMSSLFSKRRRHSAIPLFLGGLLSQVFDVNGDLLPEPSIGCISCLRQIFGLFKKLKALPTERKVRRAIDSYVQVEDELAGLQIDPTLLWRFGRAADHLWPRVLGEVDLDCFEDNLVPRHGPGAVADKLSGNRKWEFPEWNSRLDTGFPAERYVLVNEAHYPLLDRIKFTSLEDEKPARVIVVPKTAKAPRVIAAEPSCMQYAQQALMHAIVEKIERSPLTNKSIRFSDQTENGRFALLGSENGAYATIDLSEASDRVSYALVERMYRTLPHLWKKCDVSRSVKTILPDGREVLLKKWSSMGSAMCFPVLASVIFTIIVAGRYARGQGSMRAAVNEAAVCKVFGDDIIVPTTWFHDVCTDLQAFGLKVNTAKSFGTGKFRESCGVDAYAGVDVTPTRFQHRIPENVDDVNEIVSAVALSNAFHMKGYWITADYLKNAVERILGDLPLVGSDDVGYLGWTNWCGASTFSRVGGPLQSRMVRSYVVVPEKRKSPLSGHGALLKCLSHVGEKPMAIDHLEYAGRPSALRLKRKWVVSR